VSGENYDQKITILDKEDEEGDVRKVCALKIALML